MVQLFCRNVGNWKTKRKPDVPVVEMDKKVKVKDIADTGDTIGRYVGREEAFEENTRKPLGEDCNMTNFGSCSDNEDIKKSVTEVDDENIEVDTDSNGNSTTKNDENNDRSSSLVLQNNQNFAGMVSEILYQQEVEVENIEVDTDSNDILQNNKNLSGTVSGFSCQFDGRPCKFHTTQRKDVIYHVEESKLFKICGDTIEDFVSNYSKLNISEVTKRGMIMLWVISKNPSEIIRSIIEALSELDSPFPKLAHIEIPPVPDKRKDNQQHDKTIHFSSKDTSANLNSYAHMLVTYTDDPHKSEDLIQNIRTGGDTLQNVIKKSQVNKCINSLIKEVWLSQNYETGSTMLYPEQKRMKKPLMIYVKNERFDHTYKDRPGTDKEERNLRELCDTLCGVFYVIKNQTKTSLLRKTKAFIMERICDTDVLILCISSHGSEGGMKCLINELIAIFKNVDTSIRIMCCLMLCQTGSTMLYLEQKRVNKPLMIYVKNERFDHTYKDRPGTHQEERKLRKLCDSLCGVFYVIKNQKKTSLLKKMEAVIMERNRDTDVLMPFISSHGYEGGFYTRDGMKCHINELMAIFKNVDTSIPIICCLMFCLTGNNDLLVLNEWPIININQHYRDNVVIVAPYPGTSNVRSVFDGSWLVDGFFLCFPGGDFNKEKLIHKYPNGMLWDNIMEEVTCMLHDRKETDSGVMYEMLPCVILDTCRYDIFFPFNTCSMEATSWLHY